MALLTTGLIENTPVGGVRPTSTFTVKITNDDTIAATVQIEGFFVTGTTKTLYVSELFVMAPGEVAERIYFAQFDEFEFQFITSSDAIEISAWGKDAAGNLVAAHRLVPAELDPIGPSGITGATGATGATGLIAFGSLRGGGAFPVVAGTNINFGSSGPAFNTIPSTVTDTITIVNTGVYEISASLEVILTSGEGADFSLIINGSPFDPSFAAFIGSAPGTFFLRTGITVQFTLNAGDIISIRPTATSGTPEYRNASLTVIQIQ